MASPKILVLDIEGYDGKYQIQSDGNIWSQRRNRYMRPHINMFGYPVVKLTKGKKSKNIPVHRLLASHFIPNPLLLETVNHKDKNKLNNSLENLEWCSREDNVKHGLQRIYKAVSPTGDVIEFLGQAQFCRENNLKQANFSKMLLGQRRICQGWTKYE